MDQFLTNSEIKQRKRDRKEAGAERYASGNLVPTHDQLVALMNNLWPQYAEAREVSLPSVQPYTLAFGVRLHGIAKASGTTHEYFSVMRDRRDFTLELYEAEEWFNYSEIGEHGFDLAQRIADENQQPVWFYIQLRDRYHKIQLVEPTLHWVEGFENSEDTTLEVTDVPVTL
jgi:hypothetical protein